MLQDPLAPRLPSRRVWPVVLWGIVIFSVLAGVGGVTTYLWYQSKSRAHGPVPEANGDGSANGKKGFHRVRYSPKTIATETTNGTPRPVSPTPAPAPAAATTQKSAPAAKPATPPPKPKPRLDSVTVKTSAPLSALGPLYTLPGWSYIPCTVENVLNSEVEGYATVLTTLPMRDHTRQHTLVPQGQRIGIKALSADLLSGQKRIPTVAVSMTRGARDIDLTDAVVMDAAGTNGLTGKVNNKTWRLIWTSVFIEGLRLGQQVVNQSIANTGDGVTVSGVGQYSSSVAQQRLGRAQDTRPEIEVAAGQRCQVLITKALQLPAVEGGL